MVQTDSSIVLVEFTCSNVATCCVNLSVIAFTDLTIVIFL